MRWKGKQEKSIPHWVSGERWGGFLPALEEITWHVGCGALMSTTGSEGWRSLGFHRLLGQDYPAALASRVFGEQQFLAPPKMEYQGEGWWWGEHLPLRWFQLLLQVLRLSPGFDLAGVCPLGRATVNLALASLGLGHWVCPSPGAQEMLQSKRS